MFATAGNARCAERLVKRTGVPYYLLHRFSVTATAQRIVSVVIKGDVEHGTKIEIKTEQSQQLAGDVAVLADECDVILVAQLLSIWRFVSNLSQARNSSALLIDGNDWLNDTQVAQIVG